MNTANTNQGTAEEIEWFTDDPAYNTEGVYHWLAHQPVGAAEGDDIVISKGVLRMGRWYLSSDSHEACFANVGRCVIGVAPLSEERPSYPIKVQVVRVPGSRGKRFTLKAIDLGRGYRVEVFKNNPSECDSAHERGNMHADDWVHHADLDKHVRGYWRAGYWIEIFDNAGELKAGPIDPQAPFPALLF
jgi:hypothetical protein